MLVIEKLIELLNRCTMLFYLWVFVFVDYRSALHYRRYKSVRLMYLASNYHCLPVVFLLVVVITIEVLNQRFFANDFLVIECPYGTSFE